MIELKLFKLANSDNDYTLKSNYTETAFLNILFYTFELFKKIFSLCFVNLFISFVTFKRIQTQGLAWSKRQIEFNVLLLQIGCYVYLNCNQCTQSSSNSTTNQRNWNRRTFLSGLNVAKNSLGLHQGRNKLSYC